MKDLLQKIWQNKLQFLDFNLNFEDKNILDVSELAIILSVNQENYERYFLLNEFRIIFEKIHLRVDIFSIQKAQICAINLCKSGWVKKQELLDALQILQKISDNCEVFNFIEKMEIKAVDKKELFLKKCDQLDIIALELCKLSFDENAKIRLHKKKDKFKKLDFNIAVTGIMNSGKSSFLNALLKKDILGVSNIPETANLTLISYGANKEVMIYFWDKYEWQNILKTSSFNEELKAFFDRLVLELDIDKYIKDETLSQKINLEDLKNFSSAKNNISALIKKIEIKSDLEFLKNNVCIVDTPGLDDVVIQREILTNEYLKESDFLIHLMNASQALTQKDIEFLTHCLLNSRLSKFLIILTKADLLKKQELDEVKNYIKQVLKEKLKDENLVAKIDFLSVSAKMANDFYKNLASEESLEKSGMKEFENYLFNELYSGEKSKIALESYKKELLLELDYLLKEYELQNKFIQEKEQNLDEQNKQFLLQMQNQKKILKEAKDEISNSIVELQNLESGIDNLVLLLAKQLKDRLVDELKYFKNKSQKVDVKRILMIIDTTIKDGISDILREVKFKNMKKIEELKLHLSLKYDFLKENFSNDFENFKDKISKDIENIFNDEKIILLKLEIENIINQNIDLFDLEIKLTQSINTIFQNFNFENILQSLDINGAFFHFLDKKLQDYEEIQKEKLKNIEDLMNKINDKNSNILTSFEDNLQNIAKLKQLKMDLLHAN
ncbi:dynamin family protein [Campylobacter taeniopygiae]|uniref:ATP-binding protein n=1 Tax=Campylobacter taeniopygiae TaxID=2510188 RepID=A0ABY2TK88_9BACT|nr:dynamin family protein [Campylobacter taeniopygiae]TKX34530.1 ATP-binding protein [Campylobacter taeniopygiae]